MFSCENSFPAFWKFYVFHTRNQENRKNTNLGCKLKLNNKYSYDTHFKGPADVNSRVRAGSTDMQSLRLR